MRKYIKHKNMKDVACEVIDYALDPIRNQYEIRVLWHNLRGTYDHPYPFAMAKNARTPAVEVLQVSIDDFRNNWAESEKIDALC